MLDFTWKLFQETANIDTYLPYKALEKEELESPNNDEELAEEYPYY